MSCRREMVTVNCDMNFSRLVHEIARRSGARLESKELYNIFNGDDFTATGPMIFLRRLKSSMENIYDIKTEFLGSKNEACK